MAISDDERDVIAAAVNSLAGRGNAALRQRKVELEASIGEDAKRLFMKSEYRPIAARRKELAEFEMQMIDRWLLLNFARGID